MIDGVSGDEQNAADADGDVDWAFRAAGHGAFSVAAFGDQDLTPDDEATDVTPFSGDNSSGGSGADNGTDGSNELVDPEMAAAFDDIDRVASDATAYASSLEPTDESELVAHVAIGYESADDARSSPTSRSSSATPAGSSRWRPGSDTSTSARRTRSVTTALDLF